MYPNDLDIYSIYHCKYNSTVVKLIALNKSSSMVRYFSSSNFVDFHRIQKKNLINDSDINDIYTTFPIFHASIIYDKQIMRK
jgi:hypothetical protein